MDGGRQKDFAARLGGATEIHLLYRHLFDGTPARIRVWSVNAYEEVYVRSPRDTEDQWWRDVFDDALVVVADRERMWAQAIAYPTFRERDIAEDIKRAFAEKYASNPPFAARIGAAPARASTFCLRALDDDRPYPAILRERRRSQTGGTREQRSRRLVASLLGRVWRR